MTNETFKDIEKLESDLWEAADNLRVNRKPKEDEGFDLEETLQDLHTELPELNSEAAELAVKIQKNFEGLRI